MARSKAIQFLILALFLALVLCKPKTRSFDEKTLIDDENEKEDNDDRKDRIHSAAMKAIKKYRSESTEEDDVIKAARKQIHKRTPKQTTKQVREPVEEKPKIRYSDLVVKYSLEAIAEKVVEVPTHKNELVNVLLPDLYGALRENGYPMTTITTSDTKESFAVPTKVCKKIAMDTAKTIIEESETKAQKELMNIAIADPQNTKTGNELIKVMYEKIYGTQQQVELQKAFARIEQKMKLPLGTLYRQYTDGVEVPHLPEKKKTDDKLTVEEDKNKVKTDALVEDLYATINAMDLTKEQDMTESVRLSINANMKKDNDKKEEEKDKKPTWKEFLFGK